MVVATEVTLPDQLLAAAHRLLQSGVTLSGITADRLAAELQLSAEAVAECFGSKQNLQCAVLANALANAQAAYARFAQLPDARLAMEQLLDSHEALLHHYHRQLTDDLRHQLLSIWAGWQEAYEQGLQEALTACLHRGMAQGVFRPGLNPEMLARLLRVQLGKLLQSEQFLLGELAPEHVFPQLRQQVRNAVLLRD